MEVSSYFSGIFHQPGQIIMVGSMKDMLLQPLAKRILFMYCFLMAVFIGGCRMIICNPPVKYIIPMPKEFCEICDIRDMLLRQTDHQQLLQACRDLIKEVNAKCHLDNFNQDQIELFQNDTIEYLKLLQEKHPSINPSAYLSMATEAFYVIIFEETIHIDSKKVRLILKRSDIDVNVSNIISSLEPIKIIVTDSYVQISKIGAIHSLGLVAYAENVEHTCQNIEIIDGLCYYDAALD